MRNKKLLTLLATALLAGTMGIGTVLASAGTVESKPAGEGLIDSANQFNVTNFKVIETAEGDANAYAVDSVSDHVVAYTDGEWQEMLVGTPVPKELMAKPDAKVILEYDFVGFDASKAAQLLITPGSALTDQFTYGYVLTGNVNGITKVGAYRTSETAEDPKVQLIAHHSGDAVMDVGNDLAWQAYSWSAGTLANYVTTYGNATFKIEMTVNDNGWVDVTLINGFFLDWQRWTNGGATVTNWAKFDATKDFYPNVWGRYIGGTLLDGAKLSVSYTEGEETKTDVLFDNNMDQNVINEAGAEAKPGYFIARGLELNENTSGDVRKCMTITNPAAGSGIITRAALQTDKTLDTNFTMNTTFVANELSAGQKAGFAFGFEGNRSLTGAHKFFYFTKNTAGQLVFGAESVDAEGNATVLAAEQVVAGATEIPLQITGKGADIVVNVGNNAAITVADCDIDGFFAIFHKGEGNLCYRLMDSLTMTGYQFKGNEEGAGVITSNFDGNYLNGNKFEYASNVAIPAHMVATDKSHELTGITPENGKLGFYGTSTGTRVLFNKKYADFVMQFDYISVPTQERGGLVLAGNRPSAAYIVFGMKEGGLALVDPSVYAIGIYEGIATDFYGYGETVITSLGMANKCGAGTTAFSHLKATETKSETSIPEYTTGYDATAADNGVKAWYDVDPTAEGHVYSMYNKTTRVKLVCVDNQVALYLAEVNTETGAIVGDYIKVVSFTAEDAEGYVGIATDAPAYFEMDNLAITPVSREDALAATEPAANLVADIAAADMDSDPIPTPLAKPALTVSEKKVTWTAVEGAAKYEVKVQLGTETVIEKEVEGTEVDLAELTALGTYKVTVTAIPSDNNAHVSSMQSIDYEVKADVPVESTDSTEPTTPSDSTTTTDKPAEEGGCFSIASGSMAVMTLAALAVVVAKKRKEN